MGAVRVLAACLCLASCWCSPPFENPATWTTNHTHHSLDASAPAGGQDKATHLIVETTEPQLECDPQSIDVSVRKDPQPTVIDYTVVVNQPNNCGENYEDDIHLKRCEDNETVQEFHFRESGHYCVRDKNSYRLEFKEVFSECFTVSGTKLLHEEINFENSGNASVKFQQLPSWAKGLQVWIVEESGDNFWTVKQLETSNIVVQGNYSVNQQYYLWYSPVMRQTEMWEKCSGENGAQRSDGPYVYLEPSKPRPSQGGEHTKVVLIVGIIAGVVSLALLVCVIKTLITRGHDQDRRGSNHSGTLLLHTPSTSKPAGDVVLVHAQDNNHLARLCQDLKENITKHCGRRVVDISRSDVKSQTSPEAWMLQVLSRQSNTVLLVMSPAVVALHRALQQGNDVAGYEAVAEVRGKKRPWDMLLPICLRYLQEHLSQTYERLLVVKFEQVSSSSATEDISALVPAKRFLLPEHQSDLQRTLSSSSIHV